MTVAERILSKEALLQALEAGRAFAYAFFWRHSDEDVARPSAGCMSQWYPSPFVVDGVRYETAEHYMMAGKARLFGDAAMLEAILAAPSPAQVQKLGRKVRNFDTEAWVAARFSIVVDGNIAKFSANRALRDYLEGTGERVLVEASPLDRIWGIGMREDDAEAGNPRAWRGQNLLGFALMEARRRLRDGV